MYIGVPLFHEYAVDPEHHVTVTFNGHGENKKDYLKAVSALAEACAWWYTNGNKRVQMQFGGTSSFNENCWYAPAYSEHLHRFRNRLVQELDSRGVYHSEEYDYRPHVTLNYGSEPVDNPYNGITHVINSFVVVSNNFGVSEVRV